MPGIVDRDQGSGSVPAKPYRPHRLDSIETNNGPGKTRNAVLVANGRQVLREIFHVNGLRIDGVRPLDAGREASNHHQD
ncbi:MAG: hypothetical protein AAGA48_30065 [Myxococcota bacterium]